MAFLWNDVIRTGDLIEIDGDIYTVGAITATSENRTEYRLDQKFQKSIRFVVRKRHG